MRSRFLESVLALLVIAAPANAAQIVVSDAWIRALPAGLPAGGYFTLHNTGGAPVTLTGARSAACGMLMLHKSTNENGMSGMEDMASVDIPAGRSVKFAPGGFHLMCMNPTAAIKPGARISVTLQFADGTKMTADFVVKNARGK